MQQSINTKAKIYRQISKYPKISRDICFQIDAKLPYQDLIICLREVKVEIDTSVTLNLVDIYKSEKSDTKNITIQLIYEPHNKTLTTEEANSLSQKYIDIATKTLKAKVL